MRLSVAPFLVPDTELIEHLGWTEKTMNGFTDLPTEMEHWDYQTNLEIRGNIKIQTASILRQCQLAPESVLCVVVLCRSSKTRVENVLSLVEVPEGEECDLELGGVVAGRDSGGKLSIDTMLVVLKPLTQSSFAPSRPGCVLWKETHQTVLEGIGTQFPTDAEDFTETRPEIKYAAWKLSIDSSDLDAAFMSAVRLSLNTRHSSVRDLLAGKSNAETKQLQRMIDVDVTRQLAFVALRTPDILGLDVDWGEISLGGVLRNLIQQLWPKGENPHALKSQYINDPLRLESDIQHLRKILG